MLAARGLNTPVPTKHSPHHNRLLAALSADGQARFFAHLECNELPLGDVIYESGATLESVEFPADCIISLLYCMENGESGEIAVVGNEGMVGISLFMGGSSTSSRAIVQSAGGSYRISSTQLLAEFERNGEMMRLLLRYTQSLITQMTQTAACNRHHSLDEQLARWLLLSLDRLSGNTMTMTPRLIANMLSISTARVAEVTARLERLGVIVYQRGRIKVVDRPTLEKLSCECYEVVKQETDRLLPPVVSDGPDAVRVYPASHANHLAT